MFYLKLVVLVWVHKGGGKYLHKPREELRQVQAGVFTNLACRHGLAGV